MEVIKEALREYISRADNVIMDDELIAAEKLLEDHIKIVDIPAEHDLREGSGRMERPNELAYVIGRTMMEDIHNQLNQLRAFAPELTMKVKAALGKPLLEESQKVGELYSDCNYIFQQDDHDYEVVSRFVNNLDDITRLPNSDLPVSDIPLRRVAEEDVYGVDLPEGTVTKVAWERYEREPEFDEDSAPDSGVVEIMLTNPRERRRSELRREVGDVLDTIVDKVIILDTQQSS